MQKHRRLLGEEVGAARKKAGFSQGRNGSTRTWTGGVDATWEHGGSIYLRCKATGFIAKDRLVLREASRGVQRSAMGSKLQALSEGPHTDEFRRLFSPRETR